jgi:outer membrane protein assembly factor BamB
MMARSVWLSILLLASTLEAAPAWTRFRGPNGTGVNETGPLPVEFGKDKNLVWRTEMAPGYSSPVLGNRCLYVTAYDGPKEALSGYTVCLEPATGKEVWRRKGFTLEKKFISVNTPVSPTPVTDGENVYVFFESAGLIAYDAAGQELWRTPLGKFNNPYAMGNSPMLAGDRLILQADSDTGSWLAAFEKKTGRQIWRTERLSAQHGYSTPALYEPKGKPAQVVVSESYQVAGYSVATGEKLWWMDGMAWQAKSVPVVDGGRLYLHSWTYELSEIGKVPHGRTWEQVLGESDKDKDGRISKEEAPDKEMARLWFLFDLDRTGWMEEADYEILVKRQSFRNGLYAIELGGTGALKETAVKWKAEKSLPNIPSPLMYKGVVYVLKEGGILSAYDARTGAVLKQGRVEGALDPYYASPVASDGKIFTASQKGKVAVLKAAGAEWKVLQVNDLGEEIWATPAIDNGRLYVRTQGALYCFGLPR